MTWNQVDDSLVKCQSSKTQVEDLHIPDAPPELLDELMQLKQYAKTEFIFANPNSGKAFAPNTIRRHFKAAYEKAEVPYFTPHQIRHMATTTGLELCGDTDLVQRGWLSPEMIGTTYGHLGNRLGRLMDSMSSEVRHVKEPIRESQVPQGEDVIGNVINFAAFKNRRRAHT